MNSVKPIKNELDLQSIITNARMISPKYEMLLRLGIFCGLRVSDLLRLRARQFKGQTFTVTEKKTKKTRTITLDDALFDFIADYINENELKPNDYLIFSTKKNKCNPLSRVQAYRVLRGAGDACGVDGIGTHSMRKSFAVAHFNANHDIVELKRVLNHKYIHTTLMYLFDISDLNALDMTHNGKKTPPVVVDDVPSVLPCPVDVPVRPVTATQRLRQRVVVLCTHVVDFVIDILVAWRKR